MKAEQVDQALRQRVWEAGGHWDSKRRRWQLPYARVVALGLEHRVEDVDTV